MRTGKQERLAYMMFLLEKRTGQSTGVKPMDTSALSSNGWLAGFIDAYCSFQVNISAFVSGNVRLTTTAEVTQALFTYHGFSNLPVMAAIASFLLVKLGFQANRLQFRVRGASVESLISLNAYLKSYPLMSSKRLDHLDWCRVQEALVNGTARQRLDELRVIKAGMNVGRKRFDWSHLS